MSVPPTPEANVSPAKAIAAMVVAFIGSLIATLQGRTDLDSMGPIDWVIVLATTTVGFFATYYAPRHRKVTT
jgi:hypothetical protein